MCINCDIIEEKIKKYFNSRREVDKLVDKACLQIIKTNIKRLISEEDKIDEAEMLAIFYGVNTNKGKKDVEIKFKFRVRDESYDHGLEVGFDDVNFHDKGTLSDSSIDNIKTCMSRCLDVVDSPNKFIISELVDEE